MAAGTFTCPNCNTEIHVADVEESDVAVCPQCGNGYRIEYDDLREFYRLQSEEPPQRPEEIDTDRF